MKTAPQITGRIRPRLNAGRGSRRWLSWRVALVGLLAAAVWTVHYERWTRASWSVPTDYYVDAMETLARLKAASEGDIVPLRPQIIERLGAPYGANWNAYPAPDKPLMLALGALVNLIGLYETANFGLMLAHITSALAFYFVARWMRCRWEWAAAGALLFAFAYHTVHRGLAHFSLVFTWTVPLGLLAVWIVAGSKRLSWRSGGAVVCGVAAIALGVSNPYNLFFWVQLMGWALVLQWFGGRRRPNLQIGGAAIALSAAAFAVMHAEGWLYVEDTRGLPLLARNYAGTEMYALKPVEMFIPPAYHRWEWLAFFGGRYTRWSGWRGEAFLPYLGIVGIAGFTLLALLVVRRVVRREPVPGQALSIGWVIAYSMIGGITNLLAFYAGFQVFRATNRVVVFISAIVLFFLVVRLSRWSAGWGRGWSLAVAGLVAGIGVWEQIPKREGAADLKALVAAVQGDWAFGRELEAALPSGANIFQLPVLGFPEVQTPSKLDDYEHFRPYLVTSTLHFSYGAAKLRARSRWQRDLEARPMAEMVPRLEAYGFAALYINRKGYADRAESLLSELDRIGYSRRLQSPLGHQIVVFLRPATRPRLPLGEALTLGQGWHLRGDAGVRWAYDAAALSYYNHLPHPIAVDMSLTLIARDRRIVVFRQEGRALREIEVERGARSVRLAGVTVVPGLNRFSLSSPVPAVRDPEAHNQLRAFGLKESVVFVKASETQPAAIAGRP